MTGAEWKKFNADESVFTGGSYVEHLAFTVNGTVTNKIEDTDEVEVIQGTFYDNDMVGYGYNILDLIVNWRKKNG
jgi:hypothetical protein